jgi:hypothetical protein
MPGSNFDLLLPLLGKTWRGIFASSTPEKPVVDIARWELALNGQAVRILHSINHGEYGGETIILWDEATHGLIYFYFTTAGFYTRGTITVEDGKIITHEVVTGNPNGVQEVKGTSQLLPDGRLWVRTDYLQNGTWVPGRETYYVEAPEAEVLFKT